MTFNVAEITEFKKDLFWSTVSEHLDPPCLASWFGTEYPNCMGLKQNVSFLLLTLRQVVANDNSQGLPEVAFFLWIAYTF